jgi:hypothetical protein
MCLVVLSVQVSSDFIGVLCIAQFETPKLTAWNWKTGELILVIQIVAESVKPVLLISTFPDELHCYFHFPHFSPSVSGSSDEQV